MIQLILIVIRHKEQVFKCVIIWKIICESYRNHHTQAPRYLVALLGNTIQCKNNCRATMLDILKHTVIE
jgi:hypothetical protein